MAQGARRRQLTTHEEPVGPIRAGDLLVSWASYDAIMTKMIARRAHLSQRDAPGFVATYAGEW